MMENIFQVPRAPLARNHGTSISGNTVNVDLKLKQREVVEGEITRPLALRRSIVSFYFSSPLINITIFFHAKLRRNFLIRRINVTEALFAKPACLLFVKTTESHDVTRVTSQASRRRPPGAELFIDAPSNKLFSGQGASRGTATTGSFCLINARTISTRQSVVAWLFHTTWHCSVRLCQWRRRFHGRYNGFPSKNIARK